MSIAVWHSPPEIAFDLLDVFSENCNNDEGTSTRARLFDPPNRGITRTTY